MADEDVQKTLEELSRDLRESKARLEEAQRIAHVGHYYWNLIENRVIWSDEAVPDIWTESAGRSHRHGDGSRHDPP